jgi:hypothetical protein
MWKRVVWCRLMVLCCLLTRWQCWQNMLPDAQSCVQQGGNMLKRFLDKEAVLGRFETALIR